MNLNITHQNLTEVDRKVLELAAPPVKSPWIALLITIIASFFTFGLLSFLGHSYMRRTDRGVGFVGGQFALAFGMLVCVVVSGAEESTTMAALAVLFGITCFAVGIMQLVDLFTIARDQEADNLKYWQVVSQRNQESN